MFKSLKKLISREKSSVSGDFSNRDVLVGIVKNKEQYLINTANNFYHIPAHRVYLLDMPIRYVALFRSVRTFGAENSGIYVYGRVKSIRVVERREISEIPKDSSEKYYRFEIEKWIPLKEPIKAGEISRVHMFTSLPLLLGAKSVPELYMLSSEELDLYRFLDKMCSLSEQDMPKFKKYRYNGIKIGFSRDFIEIIYPDTEHVRYGRSQLYKKPYALFCIICKR